LEGSHWPATRFKSKLLQDSKLVRHLNGKIEKNRLVDLLPPSGFKTSCLAVNAAPIREPSAKPSLLAILEPSLPVAAGLSSGGSGEKDLA
jgi:hypothetical protein